MDSLGAGLSVDEVGDWLWVGRSAATMADMLCLQWQRHTMAIILIMVGSIWFLLQAGVGMTRHILVMGNQGSGELRQVNLGLKRCWIWW